MASLQSLLESSEIISQGAEAKVYKGYLTSPPTDPVLIKYRFPKKYRHPQLSAQLTRTRITSEARALARCVRSGVRVPDVRLVDVDSGIIAMEWINGKSIRFLLGDYEGDSGTHNSSVGETLENYDISEGQLMVMMGVALARMHQADIIHSDLTTSNMMLTSNFGNPELVLIDFGLSFQSGLVEDKAVDLYVLERAFASTHPESESLFAAVLESYAAELGSKVWSPIGKRLEDVRLRGRKRSMVG
ncbi:serine/threonine-protein kinase bud32 [Serendipita sp. 405]|nr:serine/threonine-protein kinase bud32 [Serendipita sp. 405]